MQKYSIVDFSLLQNVSPRSLVIVDELGRGLFERLMFEINFIFTTNGKILVMISSFLNSGTSTQEGVGICLAIAETLAGKKAFDDCMQIR